MRKLTLLAVAAFCQLANAEQIENRYEVKRWNSLQAEYKIHSGNTAYLELRTKADSTITAAFKGRALSTKPRAAPPRTSTTCRAAAG